MSLLLDALKEAEARKREAAPAAERAAPPAASPSLETEGALALAEDYVPEPVPPAPSRASFAAGSTPGGVPAAASASPVAAPPPAPAPAITPAPALAAAPTPGAEALLAARAARAAPANTRAAPQAGTAPQGPSTGARASPSAGPAAPREAASRVPRGMLPWLVGTSVVLGLLFAGLSLYDGFVNQPPAPFVPPPERSLPGGFATPADAPAAQAAPADTSTSPQSRAAAPAAAEFLVRARERPSPAAGDAVARRDAPTERFGAATASGTPRPAGPATAAPTADAVQISVSREPAPLEAAWDALQAGDLAGAESRYRQVLQSEPGQVDALLGLAVIAQSRGEDEAARRGFRRVLESVPDHPRAWAGLAELAGEGDAGVIESRLRQLLADRPSAPLHFALGNLLARQERWGDAQSEYFAAATLAPQAADYAFNVAVALERLGKAGAALPWYERALEAAGRGRAARFDVDAVRGRVAQLRAATP